VRADMRLNRRNWRIMPTLHQWEKPVLRKIEADKIRLASLGVRWD
jgi:hypothetical protein